MAPALDEPLEAIVLSNSGETNFYSDPHYRRNHNMTNDTDNWNLGDYSNYLTSYPSLSTGPSQLIQSNSTGDSPEGSDVSGSTILTDLGPIVSPPQSMPFHFDLHSSGTEIQRTYSDDYNWPFSDPQDFSTLIGQNWGSGATTSPRHNDSGLREIFVSEPESYAMFAELEDQKDPRKNRKSIQMVTCKYPDCGKSFSKKADMDRHFGSKHEEAGFLCGDCENEGTQPPPKRKDHFTTHLKTHLKKHRRCMDSTWDDFKKCPWPICQPENQKQARLFSSQSSFEQHVHLKHAGKVPEISRKSDAGPSGSQEADLLNWETSQVGTKRACVDENGTAKRPRYQEKESSIVTTDSTNGKGNSARPKIEYPALKLSIYQDAESIGNGKSFVPNVSLVDFLTLVKIYGPKLKDLGTFLVTDQANGKKQSIPVISFDASRKSIILRGHPSLVYLCKAFLKVNLQEIQSSRPLAFLDGASRNRRLGAKDHLRTDFRSSISSRRIPNGTNKIFAVRKGRDSFLIELWMKKILPSLLRILDEAIGREYSASLVREGVSEESAIAVVRIESPQVPAKTTRGYILQQLDKSCGFILADNRIAVDFSLGSLELLAGNLMPSKNGSTTDDKRELPFHTRYWKYPGMGASIGLLCTEEEFATLGCYVEVDKQKFILTVDHFIEKSYRKLRSGIDDRRTLTSPALAKVNKMKEELGHLLSSVEGEMQAEIRKQFGDGPVLPENLEPVPKELAEICRKHSFTAEFVAELERNEGDFKIGSLAHQCQPNSTAPLSVDHSNLAADLGTHSEFDIEMCHRIDWALFTVDQRAGTNRHRYRHNLDDGTTDYFPEDKENGEGGICQDTCIVKPNDKVYFVGQTNGPLTGEINAALRLVVLEGRKTLEHHIIISAEQKKRGKEYGGDSGAVVLRVSDNKLVGIVWGCFNEDPIFTPIGTTFADIKKTLDAKDVCLPKAQKDRTPPENVLASVANNTLLISGSESEVEQQRPFKSSDIVLPELTKDANEKQSRIFTATILEMIKSRPLDIPKATNCTGLPTTPREGPSSPVPSLSFSPSPSPYPISESTSLSDGEPIFKTHASNEPILINQEEVSSPSSKICNICSQSAERDHFESYLKERIGLKYKLSLPFILTNENQSQAKRKSYPQLLNPRPRHSSTWPFKTCDPWDKLLRVKT